MLFFMPGWEAKSVPGAPCSFVYSSGGGGDPRTLLISIPLSTLSQGGVRLFTGVPRAGRCAVGVVFVEGTQRVRHGAVHLPY